ncbi:hypothetical protein CPLU01_11115 [Colletotrichum plurivorum]|uniref:Uncharacterized protein n=1 Tax=Colletotrichum plurivorum TaxID=2175906 RepID=A0A8H6K3F0_9PEZI|nr:hypothetical protein CPLU01_11115 [Colletotrichum plurivorum]
MSLPDISDHSAAKSGECCLSSHHDVARDPARESHRDYGHRDIRSPPFEHSLHHAGLSEASTIYAVQLYCTYSDATWEGPTACTYRHCRHGSRQICACRDDLTDQPAWASFDISADLKGLETPGRRDAGLIQRGPKRKQVYIWQCVSSHSGGINGHAGPGIRPLWGNHRLQASGFQEL